MTEKAITPEEPTPTAPVKGIAHWSLTPEDNANVDAKINWAEGMLPSAVNNSARMMMTRIREQHDIDNAGGSSGDIKAVVPDATTVVSIPGPGLWGINFVFTDKLTEKEYASYKAGKLQLLVDLRAPKIINVVDYTRMYYNSVISINLIFKIGTNTYTHAMQFKLSFFGIEKTNTVISFHELKYFVNNTTLQVGGNNITTNYYAIPMGKTYLGSKVVPLFDKNQVAVPDPILTRQWYYISAEQCVFIDSVFSNFEVNTSAIFTASLPIDAESCRVMSITSPTLPFFVSSILGVPKPLITYSYTVSGGNPKLIQARVVLGVPFGLNGIEEYPRILTPTATNPYPLPV